MTSISEHSRDSGAETSVLDQFEQSRESGTRIISEYSEYSGFPAGLKGIEQEFHQICTRLRGLMRLVEMAVDEADSEKDAESYTRALSKQRYEYEELLKQFKAAAVQRKEKERQHRIDAREELLGSNQASEVRKRWKQESDLVAASQNVTESMKRTKNILAQELEQSGAQLAALGMSQETLTKSHTEYTKQHSKLKKAKGLISIVDWQNKSERYLLWAGLCLFGAVAFYIIQKRALYFVPPSLRPVSLVRYAFNMMFGQRLAMNASIEDPSSGHLESHPASLDHGDPHLEE